MTTKLRARSGSEGIASAPRSAASSSVDPPPISTTSNCSVRVDTSGAQDTTARRASSSGSMTKVSNEEPAEPVFSDGMSVDEAVRAVPPGAERRNIDQETLGKPLQDLSIYESCKPGSARFKVRVAVWNGKAVGIDLTVTPKSEKLADCIKGKIREVTWEKKVKSLNTIEYQF